MCEREGERGRESEREGERGRERERERERKRERQNFAIPHFNGVRNLNSLPTSISAEAADRFRDE